MAVSSRTGRGAVALDQAIRSTEELKRATIESLLGGEQTGVPVNWKRLIGAPRPPRWRQEYQRRGAGGWSAVPARGTSADQPATANETSSTTHSDSPTHGHGQGLGALRGPIGMKLR